MKHIVIVDGEPTGGELAGAIGEISRFTRNKLHFINERIIHKRK